MVYSDKYLGLVVQRADNAIQQIIAIQRIKVTKTFCVIHRKEIYPVDSIIHPSKNWGLV